MTNQLDSFVTFYTVNKIIIWLFLKDIARFCDTDVLTSPHQQGDCKSFSITTPQTMETYTVVGQAGSNIIMYVTFISPEI